MASDDEQSESRRPQDTKFKQQRLPAWQPVLTATNVLPFMFAIGLAFIPLGVAFLITSNQVQEIMVDYTHCKSQDDPSHTCAEFLANSNNTGRSCLCDVTFTLPTNFTAPVFIYYSLTNYYQNHRRYVKSRDDDQLRGKAISSSSDCQDPFLKVNNYSSTGRDYTYAPCGAIANSFFNDTLKIYLNDSEVKLLNTGIAWSTDRSTKYKNPPCDKCDNVAKAFNNTLKPRNWQKPVYELDPSNKHNTGYENEDLMVWMRTAALPTFRKLYRRLDTSDRFQGGLPAGNYTLRVTYQYPTVQFNGGKRMVISTVSWLGGKNPFLGIAYLVVGSLCIVIGFVFLTIHLKIGKSSSDLGNIPLTSRTAYFQPYSPS